MLDGNSMSLSSNAQNNSLMQLSYSPLITVLTDMEGVRPGTPEAKQLEGFLMATLFYEPSTRTRLSFESAMSRLGGGVLSTESAGQYSSAAKGETLEGSSPAMHSLSW